MKRPVILALVAIITFLFAVGCRNKSINNQAPSTTTVSTSAPTTESTIETSANTDPTIESGNGPIDDTIPSTQNQPAANGNADNKGGSPDTAKARTSSKSREAEFGSIQNNTRKAG